VDAAAALLLSLSSIAFATACSFFRCSFLLRLMELPTATGRLPKG